MEIRYIRTATGTLSISRAAELGSAPWKEEGVATWHDRRRMKPSL